MALDCFSLVFREAKGWLLCYVLFGWDDSPFGLIQTELDEIFGWSQDFNVKLSLYFIFNIIINIAFLWPCLSYIPTLPTRLLDC